MKLMQLKKYGRIQPKENLCNVTSNIIKSETNKD